MKYRKNKKSGFFLFSFSLYLSCVFLLCFLLFLLLARSYQQITHVSKNNESLQHIEKAQWHIIRLLEHASHDPEAFRILKTDYLVWAVGGSICGLMYDSVRKKLYYIQGTYNPDTQHVTIKEKNLVLKEHIVSFSYRENPFFIICAIRNEKTAVGFMIKPRRGTYKI